MTTDIHGWVHVHYKDRLDEHRTILTYVRNKHDLDNLLNDLEGEYLKHEEYGLCNRDMETG